MSAGRLKRELPVRKNANANRRRSEGLLNVMRKELDVVQVRSARSLKISRATGERTQSHLSRSLDVSRGRPEKAKTSRMVKDREGRKSVSPRTRILREITTRRGTRKILIAGVIKKRRVKQLLRREHRRKRSQRKRRRQQPLQRRRNRSRIHSPCWTRGMTSEGRGWGERLRTVKGVKSLRVSRGTGVSNRLLCGPALYLDDCDMIGLLC
mmetsp:Transcript_43916/g.138632  ORF Transcript_43916/g.138632 Transcript_43916/m.138632 type:complete len:210 (+) Transcript_43916:1050-1679(+)